MKWTPYTKFDKIVIVKYTYVQLLDILLHIVETCLWLLKLDGIMIYA